MDQVHPEHNGNELLHRLDALERRLMRLEAWVGIAPQQSAAAPATRAAERADQPGIVETRADPLAKESPLSIAGSATTRPIKPPADQPMSMPPRPPLPASPPPLSIAATAPAPPAYGTAAPRRVLSYAPKPAKAPPRQSELEQAIGLKWAGWIGAIVLVIGAALGIKYAYDQGWLGGMPDGVKLALMSLLGVALLGAGEWVYRRVNRISAAALFGAGVALLFVVSYAGHAFYNLYARDMAFVLMAIVTLIGAAVAVRGNLVSIAVLAIIGGNIAPIVLRSQYPRMVPFLAYLLMLQAVALLLAWWGGGRRWWALRGLSLATTTTWMLYVLSEFALEGRAGAPLCFTLVYAAAYQAELIASAMRVPARRAPAAAEPGTVQPGAVFSVLVTALLTAAILWIYRDAGVGLRAAWVLGLATVAAAAAAALMALSRVNLRGLIIGYTVQAGALLVVAIPVALSGPWVVLGWLGLALAYGALGAVLGLALARFAGLFTWYLAAGDLLLQSLGALDANFGHMRDGWMTLSGTQLPVYLLLGGLQTLAGQVLVWLMANPRLGAANARAVAQADVVSGHLALAIAADLCWTIVTIAALPPVGATLCLIGYAWLLAGVDVLDQRPAWIFHAAGMLIVAAFKWALVDTLAQRLSPGWSAMQYRPLFNPLMASGVLLAASMLGLYAWKHRELERALARTTGRQPDGATLLLGIVAGVALVMGLGLSLEIDRVVERAVTLGTTTFWFSPAQVKQLSWTMLWMGGSVGLLALCGWIETDPPRRQRWLGRLWWLPALLTLKYLVIDTLYFHLVEQSTRVAPAVANLEALTGLVVFALALGSLFLTHRMGLAGATTAQAMGMAMQFLSILVLLWAGTLEIDRAFERLGMARMASIDAERAKQAAISVYWGLYAIGCVILGFRLRQAALRYVGLGLFAVALFKVVLVDLNHLGTGYRILSFLALGMLLMVTSVFYGKFSPRLLGEAPPTHESNAVASNRYADR